MKKSRCAVVLGVMLAVGGSVALRLGSGQALWADGTTQPAPPAATEAANPANSGEARQHLKAALDFYNQQKYKQASDEVDAALALDPNLRDAQTLRTMIDQVSTGTGPNGTTTVALRAVLNKDEINRIKFNELTDDDLKTVTGSIPRKALDDFWKKVILTDRTQTQTSQQDYNNFIDPTNFRQQIEMIKSEQASDYFDKVIIANDPANLADFKKTVQPFVVKNCMGCHGGKENNGFPFITSPKDANAGAYTNFFIMSTLAVGGNRMIDRATPVNSLFIQYAIDPKNAQLLHPGNAQFHARFGTIDDSAAQLMVNWVKSLRFPEPNYNISFTIPPAVMAKPTTTVPATPAAGGAAP